MAEPPKDNTITDKLADLIHLEVFSADEHVPPEQRCRQAATAAINFLAGVYDEMTKEEPPNGV